ncbi:MAG: glycosyltransferase [Ignavibacteriaceae bacterium]|nr:glycosyltransferase [Ignavibacteriaceae bacterium]
MKCAAVMMQYDYGDKSRGYSYEYYNVFLPLIDELGEDSIVLFDFYDECNRSGKPEMNKKLLEFIKTEKPEFAVFCLFENEFDEATLNEIRKYTKTVSYFFDDPWRQKFVRHWINYFDFFTTPDYYMHQTYLFEKIDKAIYMPFGFNKNIYKKLNVDKNIDVSFIGAYNPYRKWVIDQLKKDGIEVKVYGRFWDKNSPWITQEEMVNVFNRSKINLNLSNAVFTDVRYLASAINSPKAIKQLILNKKTREQVKGRHYEINGCGGFQLSYFVPGLNMVYEIEKEIAVFDNVSSLPGLIKFYLMNEPLRSKIAEQGYQRSLSSHTSQNYMKKLIDIVTAG